jgi:hypothetical protein
MIRPSWRRQTLEIPMRTPIGAGEPHRNPSVRRGVQPLAQILQLLKYSGYDEWGANSGNLR